jgi:HK97 family phage major capsid protein
VTPRVVPELGRREHRSYERFRELEGTGLHRIPAKSGATAFWRRMLDPAIVPGGTLDDNELRVLSKASGSAGAYLVPTDFDDLISAARRARSVIPRVARELETPDGTVLPVPTVTAHGTGAWTAESASVTASDETFGQVSVGAFKGATKTIVSEELARDAMPAFDEFLADELGLRLAVLEDAAYAVGDGSGKPLGIAHASSGYTVITAATGSVTGFKLADVLAAYNGLPMPYRAQASWLFSPTAFSSLAGLVDTAGGLVLPSLHTDPPTLLGRPVDVVPDFPTSAASARSAAFGDWNLAYVVRRVRGIAMQKQDELHSENGQLGFRAIVRVDGRPTVLEAAVILRHSAT